MESIQVGSNALIMEVLDRNNYKHWRSRLKTYLLAEDLWEVVEAISETPKLKGDQADYKAWTIKNVKALYAIQNSCGRELFSFISEIETARSAWETLERECEVMQGFDENNSDHLERYKSFVRYVESGDWDKAKECLREIDVRSVLEVRAIDGRNGTTALHVAAMEGHAHIVKDLVHLMTQEDLKTKTDSGHTALHLAAQQGHVHVVKELPVQLMGEVQDKGGHTALHYAVHAGKVDVVKELLMRQDDFLQIKNNDGDTALHIAVQKGNVDIVKELVLLMRQEDLKTKNDAGYTALHLAVNEGNVPMVKPFVIKEKGEANIGEDEFERYIPFTTYVTTGDRDKAKGCLKELDDPCGAVTVVDPRDDLRETALHVAARRGHADVIKELLLLLKRREDHLELKTAEDFTIFGSGISLGVSEEFLLERAKYMVEQYEKTLGSILEIQNYNGSTPLHVAVIEGKVHVVKELVHFMRKEGLEIQNHYGESPLHVAVIKENVHIVKELVQFMRKEGLEIQNRYGESPLHVAVIKQNVRIVKELVPWMRRDGMEIKDSGGSNALHRAVRNRHVQIVKELTLCMIPEALEIKDGQGYTALGRALNVGRDRDAMEMARYMAERNHKVVGIPGPFDDDDIPVVSALRGGLWKSARYLYSATPLEILHGSNGSAFICYCLNSSRTLDMAWDLLQRYPILAMTVYETYKTSPMLRLASMRFAFLSATRLTRLQGWIYDSIHIRDYQVNNLDICSINVAESKHDHDDKRSFISSVMTSFRRFSQGVSTFCGIDFIYHMKSTHEWIFLFLHCMGEATKYHHLTPEQLEMVKKSVFVAIEKGHFEFVTRLCEANPRILTDTYDEHGRTIFHVAVQYRQEEVYSLLYGLDEEKQSEIGITLVNTDYNLLHIAADLFSGSYGDRIQDASLRLQRELQWFKEVGSIVPIEMHEYRRHSDGLTARELFTKTHKNLIEDAKSSMIETAHSCTVIGALIVTMMFAASFTLPGGNNSNTGLPLLQEKKLFKVFIVSDTISLVSSTISVITFLGILTSSYAEDDFLKYLLTMTKIGIFTLFFSIVTMMIVFSSALAIMLEGEAWIVIPSILFASLPALYFSWLLFPLHGKMFKSTYGPGRFGRKRKL